MSIRVMSWVMDEAPVENTTEMVVLYVLADHARDDGTCAWPSHKTIARKTRCSRRTVIRHIKAMEERGLIFRGDQRHVLHLPADKRPVVWNLNMNMKLTDTNNAGCQNVTSVTDGVSSSAERGDNGDNGGVSSSAERGDTVVTQPVLDPSIEPSMNLSSSVDEPGPGNPFSEFWDLYPRKIGKGKAKDFFGQISEDPTTADSLILAVRNFAAECEIQQTEKRYIPYPSTWLNQGRWKDYLKESPNSRPTKGDVLDWDYSNISDTNEQESDHDLPF